MTIKVHIENQDQTRTVVVSERQFDKVTKQAKEVYANHLAPGCSATFYVHLLKDVILSEQEP